MEYKRGGTLSLLVDLLSKGKSEKKTRTIPPGLKQLFASSHAAGIRRKIIFLSVLLLFFMAIGCGLIYFSSWYHEPLKKLHGKTPDRTVAHPMDKLGEERLIVNEEPKDDKPNTYSHKVIQQKPGLTDANKKYRAIPQSNKPLEEAVNQKPEARVLAAPGLSETKTGPAPSKKNPTVSLQERDSYLYTARVYESKNDYHQALEYYKKAIEPEERNFLLLNHMSGISILAYQYQEAIGFARQALIIKKDYVPALINLGIGYIKLDNIKDGEHYLSQALTLKPDDNFALLNLGLLLERQEDLAGAFKHYTKLSETGSQDGRIGTARILEKQGKTNEAIRVYREIATMNQLDNAVSRQAYERLILIDR